MSDLALPVARCPGIDAVAREVLGLNPWACDAKGIALFPGWWPYDIDDDRRPGVPLAIPAGRLVAETWAGRLAGRTEAGSLHVAWDGHLSRALGIDHSGLVDACLFAGDLLRLCSALGVEVLAGTVPRLERADSPETVWIVLIPGWSQRWDFRVDTTDPRAALGAIVREVCGG